MGDAGADATAESRLALYRALALAQLQDATLPPRPRSIGRLPAPGRRIWEVACVLAATDPRDVVLTVAGTSGTIRATPGAAAGRTGGTGRGRVSPTPEGGSDPLGVAAGRALASR